MQNYKIFMGIKNSGVSDDTSEYQVFYKFNRGSEHVDSKIGEPDPERAEAYEEDHTQGQ